MAQPMWKWQTASSINNIRLVIDITLLGFIIHWNFQNHYFKITCIKLLCTGIYFTCSLHVYQSSYFVWINHWYLAFFFVQIDKLPKVSKWNATLQNALFLSRWKKKSRRCPSWRIFHHNVRWNGGGAMFLRLLQIIVCIMFTPFHKQICKM